MYKSIHKPGAGANPQWWQADNICSQQNPGSGAGTAGSAACQNHFPGLQKEKRGWKEGF